MVVGATGGQSLTKLPAPQALIWLYWKGRSVGEISAGSLPSGPPELTSGMLFGWLGWPTLFVPLGLATLPRIAWRAESWSGPGGMTVESDPWSPAPKVVASTRSIPIPRMRMGQMSFTNDGVAEGCGVPGRFWVMAT